MGSAYRFVYQTAFRFAGSLWFFVSTYLFLLFRFFFRYFFRVQGDNSSQKNNSNCSTILPQESNQTESHNVEQEPEQKADPDAIELKDSVYDGLGEEETSNFCFAFKFQTYEEFSKSRGGNGDSVSSEAATTASTSKYEFWSENGFSGFMEEPAAVNCSVKELYVDLNDGSFGNKEILEDGFISEKDFMQLHSEAEAVRAEVSENSTYSAGRKEVCEKLEATTTSTEDHLCGRGQPGNEENDFPDDQNVTDEFQFLSEKDFFGSDSDSESITSSREFSVMSHLIDSNSDGFLSDKDFGGAFEVDGSSDIDGEKVQLANAVVGREELHLQKLSFGHEPGDFNEEYRVIMQELQKLDEHHMQNSGNLDSEFLSEKDYPTDEVKTKHDQFGAEDAETSASSDNYKKPSSQNQLAGDSEDSNGLETQWEHQELIEQLKMELKKVRATGLPTILEESESPKIMEDLKPWKIDEKFQHEDRMGELHKFYKSYRERMRKFDILNYQKMYAIGFLQLKDPLQSISSRKASGPAITAFLSQNFSLFKRKKIECDPMKKFIGELYSDLEVVYVGHLCLSWEFLHWQYDKALELWESDPHGLCQYNEVAGEFQQFQVLLQRFIENEPFQGPRVQNYVKNRCILRNLLQVPVMREDGLKNGKKTRRRAQGADAITSDMLVEIMEESIRIFWQFVRGDKDAASATPCCRSGTQVELQNPTDSELLMNIRTSLQKKEKKLKDLLRTGNCILKRIQKHQEDGSDQVLYFFSQVDMKLVSRVLNMSRITTDQLVWCGNKLNKINFVNRKIHVEPSFLLFPC